MMYRQFQLTTNATGTPTYAIPSTPPIPSQTAAITNSISVPGVIDGFWIPGANPETDIHMGLAIGALVFYGIIILIALFCFIVVNRCRIFKNGWWMNIIMVCMCRISSSGLTIQETLHNNVGAELYYRNMYSAAIVDDILCLVALYNLHLAFVERLCRSVGKWSLRAICFWLMFSHVLAEPFLIAATWSTLKGRQHLDEKLEDTAGIGNNSNGNQQQILSDRKAELFGKQILLVGLTIGLYCFAVQSIFAFLAVKKEKVASNGMRFFELGVLIMIPLIVTRVVSIAFMFWLPAWDGFAQGQNGHNYADYNLHDSRDTLQLYRLYIEIIPETVTMLLAVLLAFLAPKYLPDKRHPTEVDNVISQQEVDCMPRPGALGMAFTPLKLNSTNILMQWYNAHLQNPFPTEEEKLDLVERTGFTIEMIDDWFEDTRACTCMQQIQEENENVEPRINNTDGIHDIDDRPEERPILYRAMLVPPPIMLGPRHSGRIMTPPSDSLRLRLPLPGTSPGKRTKAYPNWGVAPKLVNWAILSLRGFKSVVTSEPQDTEIVRRVSGCIIEENPEKVMEEGAWFQPRALSRRIPNRAAQGSRISMQMSVRRRPVETDYNNIINVDNWSIVIPRRRNSVAAGMGRIQELTHDSAEETKRLDQVKI